jgi:hypothetical protein
MRFSGGKVEHGEIILVRLRQFGKARRRDRSGSRGRMTLVWRGAPREP